MPARQEASIAPPPPTVACVAADGCSYLRDLATIEHIAGFEHTARRYAAAAAGCRKHGCWAVKEQGADAEADSTLVALAAHDAPRRRSPDAALRAAAEAIPFRRSSLIDILTDADGNYVERRPLKFTDLPAKGDTLGYLYRYWLDLRGAGALRFSNIDTVHLNRAGAIGSLHVVDVSGGDPDDFRFELFGYAVPINRLERLRALPVRIYADTTMRDYNTVRLTGVPRLHRIHCRLGDTTHHYTRLILPFLDQSGRVARLCVAIRQERGNSLRVEASH